MKKLSFLLIFSAMLRQNASATNETIERNNEAIEDLPAVDAVLDGTNLKDLSGREVVEGVENYRKAKNMSDYQYNERRESNEEDLRSSETLQAALRMLKRMQKEDKYQDPDYKVRKKLFDSYEEEKSKEHLSLQGDGSQKLGVKLKKLIQMLANNEKDKDLETIAKEEILERKKELEDVWKLVRELKNREEALESRVIELLKVLDEQQSLLSKKDCKCGKYQQDFQDKQPNDGKFFDYDAKTPDYTTSPERSYPGQDYSGNQYETFSYESSKKNHFYPTSYTTSTYNYPKVKEYTRKDLSYPEQRKDEDKYTTPSSESRNMEDEDLPVRNSYTKSHQDLSTSYHLPKDLYKSLNALNILGNSPKEYERVRSVRRLGSVRDDVNKNEQCRCGIRSQSGQSRDPWSVSLDIRAKPSLFKDRYPMICGGSLLNHAYVLTAAHCLCSTYKKDRILCVNHDDNNDNQYAFDILPSSLKQIDAYVGEYGDRYVGVRVIVPLERIQTETEALDIGLLKISPDVMFSVHVAPICLDGLIHEPSGRVNDDFITVIEAELPVKDPETEYQYPDTCMTGDKLPKPNQRCVDDCKLYPTPDSNNPICQEVRNLIESRNVNYDMNGRGDSRQDVAVIVTDLPSNSKGSASSILCFPGHPGPNGWCHVDHDQSWGYCSESCKASSGLQQQKPKQEKVIRIQDLKHCSRLKGFRPYEEFCSGYLDTSNVWKLSWQLRNQDPLMLEKPSQEDLKLVMERDDLCEETGGEPAIQWSRNHDASSNLVRAIQIGVASRSVGCQSRSLPTIYAKVVNRKTWIEEHIASGGCATFV